MKGAPTRLALSSILFIRALSIIAACLNLLYWFFPIFQYSYINSYSLLLYGNIYLLLFLKDHALSRIQKAASLLH